MEKKKLSKGFNFKPDENVSGLEECLGMLPTEKMNNILKLQSEAIKADFKKPGTYNDFIKRHLNRTATSIPVQRTLEFD